MENLASDRKGWRRIVKERMEHLAEYEKSKGKRWTGEVVERNKKLEQEDVFARKYVAPKLACRTTKDACKDFVCGKCGKGFKQEANLANHSTSCV